MPVRVLNDEIEAIKRMRRKKREREREKDRSRQADPRQQHRCFISIVDDLSIDDDDATKKKFLRVSYKNPE